MIFAYLAIFQAIEFVDQPVPKTLDILYVRQAKAKLPLQNPAFCKCCLRRASGRLNSHPQFPRFPLGPPGSTVPEIGDQEKEWSTFLTYLFVKKYLLVGALSMLWVDG